MEPLLDEDSEGSCDECNEETQNPKSVDNDKNSRFLERWSGEVWDSRIHKVPIDGEMGNLDGDLHEDMICEVLRLLL